MNKINPNFGYWLKNDTYHYKFSISNNILTTTDNPYVNIIWDNGNLYIYAIQDIAIAFSLNCFNPNFSPSNIGISYNPTYVCLSDPSYSTNGDACDLTIFRSLEKGYGLKIIGLFDTTTYNIELLIR